MIRRKKILLTNSSDIYSGGEYFVLELGKVLKKEGFEVTICCRPDIMLYDKAKTSGIDLFGLYFPPKWGVYRFGKIIYDFIRKNNIDIVHTNNNYDRTVAGYAAKLAGAGHVANVHSYHSISHNPTHYIRNRYYTDYFIVDGKCTKELLINEDGICAKKIKVIHLGIEAGSMKRDLALRKKIRSEFGIEDTAVLFGNTGRLVEFKGQEYLIKAFALVCSRFGDAKLMIVGNGKLEIMLKNLASDLNITDKIIFTGFRDDMQAVYSAFDVYLHSSVEGGGETFPFSVLYSLAQGIPAVVTDVGDVAEMIENDVTGYSVIDKDPDAMAEKIICFLNNRDVIPVFGSEALKRLNDKFTIEIMSRKIINVYNSLK